jgi:hypothetical protein
MIRLFFDIPLHETWILNQGTIHNGKPPSIQYSAPAGCIETGPLANWDVTCQPHWLRSTYQTKHPLTSSLPETSTTVQNGFPICLQACELGSSNSTSSQPATLLRTTRKPFSLAQVRCLYRFSVEDVYFYAQFLDSQNPASLRS